MTRTDRRVGAVSRCQWFVVDRPVVGRVFVAHQDRRLVLATGLADPPGRPRVDADSFVRYLRGSFGCLVEQDPNPDTGWPFNQVREPFQARDLVDLSSLTYFQRRVLEATARIPLGQCRTYGDVADAVGSHPRPVGQAMDSNPAPLVIPCHRVVKQGDLGGWVYGEELKRRLLAHEGVHHGGRSGWETPRSASSIVPRPLVAEERSLEERIRRGESEKLEFKPSAGRAGSVSAQHQIVKTVCGFLNSAAGGELVIGVGDDGRPLGLGRDLPADEQLDTDKYQLFIQQQLLKPRLHMLMAGQVSVHFEDYQGATVCVVGVKPSPDRPVFAQPLANDGRSWRSVDKTKWDFWVRDGNATPRYEGERLTSYVLQRWSRT